MEGLIIRRLEAKDEPALRIALADWEIEPWFLFQDDFEDYLRFLDQQPVYYGFLGETIVGRLVLRPDGDPTGDIGYIVLKEFRRRGIGTVFLKKCYELLGRPLSLIVPESNEQSWLLIEKEGAKLLGISQGKRRYTYSPKI
jgi:RimJ/RimL family protein N-acetyltransferase